MVSHEAPKEHDAARLRSGEVRRPQTPGRMRP
jgi:hypothetical protein